MSGAERAGYPMLVSEDGEDGAPIGWGALSGLAADPDEPGILHAVNDSFYAMQPTIFTIDARSEPARIVAATRVTRGGMAAQLLDLEGITPDGEGGFRLASEGRSERLIPHAIYHVGADGEIDEAIAFPPELRAGGGYVVDKVEGFAVDAAGVGWIVTDNDGVDDSNGETRFYSIGAVGETAAR